MGRVFVVQQPQRKVSREDIDRGFYNDADYGKFVPMYDLTPALQYGDIELLLDTATVGIAIEPARMAFREKLRGFCDDDYIVPVGNPAMIMLAGIIAADYNAGRVNVLQWDRRQKRYIKMAI